jgi:putative ABC transport system ATP-binding protein
VTDRPLLSIRGVSRRFGSVQALRDVSFDVETGTMVALVGRSGSGKTTLLNVVGGLDRPDTGTVEVDGTEVTGLDEEGLSRLRRDTVAYVFQTFGLIPVLTAAENVGVPLRMRRTATAERERRVAVLLDLVGLADHADQRPGELSGGQQQRAAIARAMVNLRPRCRGPRVLPSPWPPARDRPTRPGPGRAAGAANPGIPAPDPDLARRQVGEDGDHAPVVVLGRG